MAEQPSLSFAQLLRQLRAEARLTQEELAEAAKLSPRSVSDLERGISRTARKDTALLLADALGLAGPVRAAFIHAPVAGPRRARCWRPGRSRPGRSPGTCRLSSARSSAGRSSRRPGDSDGAVAAGHRDRRRRGRQDWPRAARRGRPAAIVR